MADTRSARAASSAARREERLDEEKLRRAVEEFKGQFDTIASNVEKVVKGKPEVVRLAVTCMLADGHLLIEDVPGVGKTSLARALAETIDGSLQRIQFTPDLLPSDVTGVQIYSQATHSFEFHVGPVFANVVVADEINRASPKTQAALLEVMEEHQVSVDGEPHRVPEPFLVLATQNPIELDGTYELPEAQLDRFLMRVHMGYPDAAAEMDILDSHEKRWEREELVPVLDTAAFTKMTRVANLVYLGSRVKEYLVALAASSRSRPDVRIGVSPRGTIALASAAKVWAAANGRHFVTPDDVRRLAPHVFPHRIIVTPEAELQGITAAKIVEQIVAATPVDETDRR